MSTVLQYCYWLLMDFQMVGLSKNWTMTVSAIHLQQWCFETGIIFVFQFVMLILLL